MDSALVSVIMPVYKGDINWINESVKSVFNQSYNNIELIIINDFPTREEENYFSELKKNYNIVYHANFKKTSIGHVRNQGILLSKGKYIAQLDCDDIRDDKDKIKKQVKFLEKNPDYGMCGASIINYIDKSGNHIKTNKKPDKYKDIMNKMLITNLFVQSGILISKKCLDEVGLYIENSLAEDYEMWLRIGSKYKITNIDTSVKYRINQQSLGHSSGFKTKKAAFKFVRKYIKYYPNKFIALIIRTFNIIIPVRISEKIAKILGI